MHNEQSCTKEFVMDYEVLISTPISAENSCGENLEDDSGFQSFFFEAEGTPERYDGSNTLPAEPPDWRDIKKKALAYLDTTKDLKLIAILSQAVLNTEGIVKFEECLKGLSTLLQGNWDEVFPPLDEDDGDPMERVSALGDLNHSFIVNTLKNTPLGSVKGLGEATLSTIEKAVNGADDSPLTLSQIKGIFSEISDEDSTLTYTAIAQCSVHLSTINQLFIDKSGNEYSISFDTTIDTLSELQNVFAKYGKVAIEIEEPESDSDDEGGADISSASQNANQSGNQLVGGGTNVQPFSQGGRISSRKDVEKCFEMILDYYETYESSSPVPILVNRANKLVNLSFLEIMKDIYPDAITTLQQLGGLEDKEEEADSGTTDDNW